MLKKHMSTAQTSKTQIRLIESWKWLRGVATWAIIVLLLSFAFANYSIAQEKMEIKNFQLKEHDTTAFSEGKKDQNDAPMSLIRVQTTEKGFSVDAGSMYAEKDENHIAEIWIWVSYGTKHITIKHSEFGSSEEFWFPSPIAKSRVYQMDLITPKTVRIIRQLSVSTSPRKIKLLLGDSEEEITSGFLSKRIAAGTYAYVAEAEGYQTKKGKVTVDKDNEDNTLNIILEPLMADLVISTNGDEIYIDNELQTSTLISLQVGKHVLKVTRDGYYDHTETITIEEGWNYAIATLKAKPKQPKRMKYTFTSEPTKAMVFIDGVYEGLTPLTTYVWTGARSVRITKEGYYNYIKSMIVDDDENGNISARLEKKKYTIRTSPSGAIVKVGSQQLVGTTPISVALPDGNHTIEIRKDGFKTTKRQISVSPNQDVSPMFELKPARTLSYEQLKEIRNKMYIEGYTQMSVDNGGQSQSGIGLAVGKYVYNVNAEAFFTYIKSESETLYWSEEIDEVLEDTQNPTIKTQYKSNFMVGAKVGYGLHARGILRLTPQVGASFLKLKATNIDAPAHGAYCVSGVASARLSIGMRTGLYVMACPEYYRPLKKTEGYADLSDISPTIDSWGNGFKVKLGIGLIF